MTADDPREQKRILRAALRQRRRVMVSSEREAATARIAQHLTELTTRLAATSISAYLPARDEPNIRPFLDWADQTGIRVLYPISRDDGLLDWSTRDGEGEVAGLYGMPEPAGRRLDRNAINDVDLIIVPAAAVDRTGLRLGWGRGYFDKMLGSTEKCPPVYAVVFDNEYVDVVPREVHDRPVNGVVTPSAIISFEE